MNLTAQASEIRNTSGVANYDASFVNYANAIVFINPLTIIFSFAYAIIKFIINALLKRSADYYLILVENMLQINALILCMRGILLGLCGLEPLYFPLFLS